MKKTLLVVLFSFLIIPQLVSASFDVNLKYGSKGQAVVDLQKFLWTQNLYAGPVTGNMFGLTQTSVKAFQLQHGIIPASGFWGPLTRAAANLIQTSDQAAYLQQQLDQANANAQAAQTIQQQILTPPVPAPQNNQKEINSIRKEMQANTDAVNAYNAKLQKAEDDIRAEVQAAGGFATESQIMAEAIGRVGYMPAPPTVSPLPHAICSDGTASYSANNSGTCSYHGGVSTWLY